MIARTAFTQLRYSPWLLAGMGVVYLAPPLLALARGPRDWPAWGAMCAAYAPLLPLVALFHLGATTGSALRYWCGRGGQWKTRVQAPITQRRG